MRKDVVLQFLKVPEEEDEASFARHNRALKVEFQKTKPNCALVAELMKLSFEMRRNRIISESIPLAEILLSYPFLRCPEEVFLLICLLYDALMTITIIRL